MLKRTKGFVSLAAAIALMLGLCSCSGKPETDPSTTADPTGIGAQAETGENTTAKDIAPESSTPETAAKEASTAKEAGTAAPTEKTTKGKNNHVNVSAAGFIWPVPGYTQLSSPYSTQYKRISIKADFGAKVVACASGRITKIYNKDDESKTPCAVLTCDNGYVIEYSAANFSVKVGDVVARGDSIGFVGRYGTGPHLNISATKDGASIDPATIIKP
jgi:murein DD-endopeptidase MepM/ murein hydrolase activator NlpD